MTPDETPDGRPGVSLLFFSFGREKLEQAVFNRVAQCILTCPTTACFNGLPIDPAKSLRVGGQLDFSAMVGSKASCWTAGGFGAFP